MRLSTIRSSGKKTEKAVRFQEEVGLDVLVHGEFERNDMVEYFGEQLAGFAVDRQWMGPELRLPLREATDHLWRHCSQETDDSRMVQVRAIPHFEADERHVDWTRHDSSVVLCTRRPATVRGLAGKLLWRSGTK